MTPRAWPGDRGTGRRDGPSQRCHDRSFPRVRPCLATTRSWWPRSPITRSPASERAAAEALVADVQPVRRPARRPPRTARRDPGDAHARAADRLHADRARRRPPPFGRLAPFVAILGTSRDALSRPLAVGLTTLGLAGLLVAAAPSFMIGQCLGGAAPTVRRGARPRAPAAADRRRVRRSARRRSPAASAAAAAARIGRPGSWRHRRVGRSVGGARSRGRAAIADGATQPPGTEAYTNGIDKAQAGATGGKSGESPTPPATCWPRRTSAASRPSPVLSVAFLVAGLGAVRPALDGAPLRRLTAPSLEVRGARGYT